MSLPGNLDGAFMATVESLDFSDFEADPRVVARRRLAGTVLGTFAVRA